MRVPAAPLPACLASVAIAAADTTLGSGVTLETPTPIADVIANPASVAGWTVRVEGVVTAGRTAVAQGVLVRGGDDHQLEVTGAILR